MVRGCGIGAENGSEIYKIKVAKGLDFRRRTRAEVLFEEP